ncbi:MAG TPA: superoxide dismutase family protein [Chloroflexota bacterium]|jgi:Cu-Zn family superoxide dismutase
MQRETTIGLLALGAGVLLGLATSRGVGAVQAAVPARPVEQARFNAWASLQDASGRPIGVAILTEDAAGLHVRVQASGLPPGVHGIHIHEVAVCTPPDFTNAGGHFNPGHREHGIQNLDGPHAGDLENLLVETDGTATYDTIDTIASLGLGNPAASILDGNGSALVIHALPDDNVSEPDGKSGARIACGPIVGS